MDAAVLPESWCVSSLNEIAQPFGGSTPSKSDASFWNDGTVPWVSPKDMKVFDLRGSEDLVSEKALARLSLIPEGSILVVVRSGILSRILPVAINHLPVTINQDMRAFVPAPEISARFIALQLLANQREILGKCSKDGTTVASIEALALASFPLALPPSPEQHRIVARIEELFSELDQGVASLKTAREQLKVYRQSLLKNAFEGKLTAAWRAAHAEQLETAAALQQRIGRERQARYQQQLADWQTAGQSGPKPKPPKPLPPLTAEELTELPELPAGWGWIRVGELVDRVTVGYVGPMKAEYLEEGVPFLRSQNVRENRFDPEGLKFVSETFHRSLSKSALSAGDVVVVRSGSIGVSCVIPEHLGEANCSDLVIIKAPRHVSSHLLAYYMNWQTQGRVKQKMVGVALIHFNTKSVEGFSYPLCSEQEQQQIEKLLAEKLSEADQLDQTLATALQQADALRQSILKKAFSGQLVAQDPNDEPAAAMLERIRAEKSNGMKNPGKKRRNG